MHKVPSDTLNANQHKLLIDNRNERRPFTKNHNISTKTRYRL